MGTIRWPRRGRFHDRATDISVQGPDGTIDTADLDDDVVERLLERGFERVEDDDSDGADGSASDSDSDESTDGDAEDPDDLARWKDGFSGNFDPDDVDDDVETGTLPFNPDSLTIPDIRERVQDIDDPAAIRALRNIEAEQQARTGADEAFEGRLSELETDDAGD